jgi:hypothetical protein
MKPPVKVGLSCLGLVVGSLVLIAQPRVVAQGEPSPPSVTISTVAASFYGNPGNSGAFDPSQLSNPVFTQSFPRIDFNPPASAQVACSNSTGVDENTRPFTDVIPNGDAQTCSTRVAAGNGLEAGTGDLTTFEAVMQAKLTVGSAAQVTFNFFSDDGWILGLGQREGGTIQPTYVSGQLSNPPPSSPVRGFPVVGALNGPSAPTQAQVTVNFPAAGVYPMEIDYTECCGGQLALTLGTTAGNPILPGPEHRSCGSTETITPISTNSFLPAQATVALTNGVALFAGPATIPASSYTATIDWGDQTTSSGRVDVTSVFGVIFCVISGDHTYARPGHYATSVTLSAPSSGPISFAAAVVGASPPTVPAGSFPQAIGVLTSDRGPQCTATVVDLARSSDLAHPGFNNVFRNFEPTFNNNIVVTAAHCVTDLNGRDHEGFMFAPGFTGIAPRKSVDFATGKVSGAEGGFPSPFAGQPIGSSPYGVWGCSRDSLSNRTCGPFGIGDAAVFVPKQYFEHASDGGNIAFDYAFLLFGTPPENESRSLTAVTGGLPITFDPEPLLGTGVKLQHVGYDVDWLDANRPGNTMGWPDLINPPETLGANCASGGSGLQGEHCFYFYRASSAAPRTCSPSVDSFVNLSRLGRGAYETQSSLLASQCDLGTFSSGAPFITSSSQLIGVTKTGIHAGPLLDDASSAQPCCTAIVTPLRFEAALLAFRADRA